MATTPEQNTRYLYEVIKVGIENEIGKVYDRKHEELLTELDRDKKKVVAGILLQVMKQVDI